MASLLSNSEMPTPVPTLQAEHRYSTTTDGMHYRQHNFQRNPARFQCTMCPKQYTRAFNLRNHLRGHVDERNFSCTVCGKSFVRNHDRKMHERLHSGEKKFTCGGDLESGGRWGCGRRFSRGSNLKRHFHSKQGRICIQPPLDDEMLRRQRQSQMNHIRHMQPSIGSSPAVHEYADVEAAINFSNHPTGAEIASQTYVVEDQPDSK